jgi:hypothetical protein
MLKKIYLEYLEYPNMTTLVDINSSHNWLAFLSALFTIECLLLLTFRLFPNFWGDTINIWYDKYGLSAILCDVGIVLIGFWITQWLYSYFFGTNDKDFKLWKFILLFLAVQIIHDLLFYFIILRNLGNTNTIFELILSYGNKHGGLTILGDSLMVVLAILATYLYLDSNLQFGTYIIILLISIYLINYLLYQKWH